MFFVYQKILSTLCYSLRANTSEYTIKKPGSHIFKRWPLRIKEELMIFRNCGSENIVSAFSLQ